MIRLVMHSIYSGRRVWAALTMAVLVAPTSFGCAGSSATRPCAQETMTAPPSRVNVEARDPTETDPDKYKAVMENDRVRVLRYHDEPGAKTHRHHHPASVLYALSTFKRRLVFPDGTTKEREFHPGDVMWVPEQTHIGENIGATPTEVLLVEMKEPAGTP